MLLAALETQVIKQWGESDLSRAKFCQPLNELSLTSWRNLWGIF